MADHGLAIDPNLKIVLSMSLTASCAVLGRKVAREMRHPALGAA
jgi:hypothetical protein